MNVSPMVLAVAGEKNAPGQLRVVSHSSETQYVKVTVKRLVNPATDEEHEEDVTNWSGTGIAVSPMKFVLPANSSRAVRVISLSSPAQDQAYRVYFEGVSSPEDEPGSTATDTLNANVKINVVWGVLVRAGAKQGVAKIERQENVLRNTGNVRLGVISAGNCADTKDSASCEWHAIERSIYPGATYTLPRSLSAAPLRVKYKIDSSTEVRTLDLAANG